MSDTQLRTLAAARGGWILDHLELSSDLRAGTEGRLHGLGTEVVHSRAARERQDGAEQVGEFRDRDR
jgi:hypothetical protein